MYILQKYRHIKCRNDATQKDGAIYTRSKYCIVIFLKSSGGVMSREEGQGPGRRASKRTHTFSIFLDGDKVEGNTSTPRHYIEPTHSAPQIGSHAGAPAKKPPHPSAGCGQWTTLTWYQSCRSSCFTSVGISPPRSSGISKTWLKLGTQKAPRNTNISASRSHPHKSWLSWERVTWMRG